MNAKNSSRSFSITRRQLLVSTTVAVSAWSIGDVLADETKKTFSSSEESIHHEINFKAEPKRVYDALVESRRFNEVVKLSAAVKSGMALGDKPTSIAANIGGAFSVFGGHIVGRQIELVPNRRIVQAWRVIDWEAGVFSIARYELTKDDAGTKLIFTHTGFPKGQAEHLSDGWQGNYWEPLEKYLAMSS